MRSLAEQIRPLLLTCEIRTVAADGLWMSTAHDRASVALHFTWKPEPQAVAAILVGLEQALSPFSARPHWGKVFRAGAETIASMYEKHADFLGLVERLDPRAAFRNTWLEENVLGSR